LQLKNYELKCELYQQRGYGNIIEYDSVGEVDLDEMSYEDILMLGERIGEADTGIPT
jgi:hypothetical protein